MTNGVVFYFEIFTVSFRECTNLLEAASQGAIFAVSMVANVVVNLLSFLALVAFFDATISWLGGMFDYPQLSFSIKDAHNMCSNDRMYRIVHVKSSHTFRHLPADVLVYLHAIGVHYGSFVGRQLRGGRVGGH